jgi:hypothetical protein
MREIVIAAGALAILLADCSSSSEVVASVNGVDPTWPTTWVPPASTITLRVLLTFISEMPSYSGISRLIPAVSLVRRAFSRTPTPSHTNPVNNRGQHMNGWEA